MESDLQLGPTPVVDDQLGAFEGIDGLPTGAAPDPAPTAPAVDTSNFITREQYEAQQRELESLRSIAPIAQEFARDPQLLERVRRGLILGDVAAPGTYAAQHTAPPAPAPAALTPEQIQDLRNKLVENPAQIIVPVAKALAQQEIAAALGPIRMSNAQTALQLFMSRKQMENGDEYALVAPHLQRALASVPPEQLAQADPQQLNGMLEFTYRACRGDMYAERNAAGATAPQLPGAVPAAAQPPVPPYAGAAGAPAAQQTVPLTQRAHRRQLSPTELDLAQRSGLTQEDFKKYGPLVVNEMTAS